MKSFPKKNTVITSYYGIFSCFTHSGKYNPGIELVINAANSKANTKLSSAKKTVLYFLFLFPFADLLSQPCSVNADSLKGQYVGGCKRGKANGKGTATGVDSYTGNFKNGYPDGYGKYTWKNGNWYDGFWKDGLFDGQGTLRKIDNTKSPDGIAEITGFWKKGQYVSRYEHPYSIKSLTNGVNDISINKLNAAKSEITIIVKSSTAGGSNQTTLSLPKVFLTNIQMIEGRFEAQITDESSSTITNKYVFQKVTFPFYAIISFKLPGTNQMKITNESVEQVSVKIFEVCNCHIQINIDR